MTGKAGPRDGSRRRYESASAHAKSNAHAASLPLTSGGLMLS
jgi:hypothetical protein